MCMLWSPLDTLFKNGIDHWIWFHNNNNHNNIEWAVSTATHLKCLGLCLSQSIRCEHISHHHSCFGVSLAASILMQSSQLLFYFLFFMLRTLSASTSVYVTWHHTNAMSVKRYSLCARVCMCRPESRMSNHQMKFMRFSLAVHTMIYRTVRSRRKQKPFAKNRQQLADKFSIYSESKMKTKIK